MDQLQLGVTLEQKVNRRPETVATLEFKPSALRAAKALLVE
jgi:hypothetical protein